MSIYIKNLEMPEESDYRFIRINSDGTILREIAFRDLCLIKDAKATSIQNHGDLIDRDALLESIKQARKEQPEISEVYDDDYFIVADWLMSAPVIIKKD